MLSNISFVYDHYYGRPTHLSGLTLTLTLTHPNPNPNPNPNPSPNPNPHPNPNPNPTQPYPSPGLSTALSGVLISVPTMAGFLAALLASHLAKRG